MGIVSYAQNFEDVMLWRALGHIEDGFYIDIGANDPVVDSVSLTFHQRGWKGIHVEPMTSYANLLRQQRPGDQIIQAAVGTEAEIIRFYEIPGEGISTGDSDIAQQHRERGFQINEIRVPAITLNAILQSCDAPEVHWMKIDVEGFEKQVITSWSPSKCRPWVVVVESTLPMTQIPSHQEWESTLKGYGYQLVYFDGLNRYYLSKAHTELKKHFAAPPNVFDDFTLNGTAHAPFHRLVEMRYQETIKEIESKNESQQDWSRNEINRISQLYAEYELQSQERENTLRQQLQALELKDQAWILAQAEQENRYNEQIQLVKQELETVLRSQIQREQELSEEIISVQKTSDKEKQELRKHYQELTETLQREYSEHQWLMNERIETLNQALRQVHEEKAYREQEYAEQLQNVLPQTDAEKTALHEHYQEKLNAINRERAEHEWLTGERIFALNEAMHQLQSAKTQREQQLFEQILNIKELAEKEKSAIHRHYQNQLELIEREQDEHQWLTTERIQALNQTIQELQAEQTAREQEHNRQLVEARHQAEADKAALREYYQAKMGELQHVQAEHEWLTGERIHKLNESLSAVYENSLEQEKIHNDTIKSLYIELSKADEMQALQEKRHNEKLQELIDNINKKEQLLNTENEELRRQAENTQQELTACQLELKHKEKLLIQRKAEYTNTITELQKETSNAALQIKNKDKKIIEHSINTKKTKEQISSIIKEIHTQNIKINNHLKNKQGSIKKIFFHKEISDIELLKHELTSNINKLAGIIQNELFHCDLTSDEVKRASINTAPQPKDNELMTLDKLLNLNDKHFIYAAYKEILGRNPDESGYEYYLNRLRCGTDKLEIVSQLVLSSEGKSYDCKIQGLKKAIKPYKYAKNPIIQLISLIKPKNSNEDVLKKLRAIENSIHILRDEIKQDLSNKIIQCQANTKETEEQEIHQTTNYDSSSLADKLKILTPTGREIYTHLKKKIHN